MDEDVVDRLRSLADQVDDVPVADIEKALREAAEAIERLRNEMDRWAPLVAKGLQKGIQAR
ncbi:hypothetical protein AncyloWKF20_07440 [Ancylobacter sp. WKF20]|uniref:hypothetical protein n=1 Tax=Ancylobacter sp. WKF20 TaxID=3039801 RepID=UPI0024342ACB|nr:hypothetical protein [Ancylobacter sp. WKF20]WGD31642.1 hypothetical protein AncyloWKF20_07440 [Ancylobacter sp. WKF20]